MSRRAEEWLPLPARLHPLADACGWMREAFSQALAHRTWVPRRGEHIMQNDLAVPRGRGDLDALVAAAPAAAHKRAEWEDSVAAQEEAEAAAILARATARREKAARIRAELAALTPPKAPA